MHALDPQNPFLQDECNLYDELLILPQKKKKKKKKKLKTISKMTQASLFLSQVGDLETNYTAKKGTTTWVI